MSGRVKPPRSGNRDDRSDGSGSPRNEPDGPESIDIDPKPVLTRAAIDSFFEGVDQMRAYLDRHIQDPERRRARLARVAQELVRPRKANQLGQWLTGQLREAVGARACTILLRETEWHPWLGSGKSARLPHAAMLSVFEDPSLAGAQPLVDSDDILVPMLGVAGVLGAIWIEGGRGLDPASHTLLGALADTAGVILEQGLGVESLIRDPQTGLLNEGAFIDRAREALRKSRAGRVCALVAFRVAGTEAIRQAQGARAVEEARRALARAVEATLGPDTPVGARFDDVLALLVDLPQERAGLEMATRARDVAAELQERTSEPGPILSASATYVLVSDPEHDLLAPLERIERQLAGAPAGSVTQVDEPSPGS